ncbi:glycosyltransferase family 39 protein [Streptomyces sp. NPDC020096]
MSTLTRNTRLIGDPPQAAPEPPGDTGQARPPRRWPEALRHAAPALAGYAAIRTVSLALFTVWGACRDVPVWHRMGTLWDATAYLRIAARGYPEAMPAPDAHGRRYSDLAFFPLYPMSVKAVHAVLPVSVPWAALLVAWVAAGAAACGIFAVAAHLYGRRTGIAATMVWAALPHAVVANLAYTEALFAALTAWTLYAVLTRRWLWAGALSSAACLTRPTGIAVAAAVAAAAAGQVWRQCREQAVPWRLRRQARFCWRPVLGAVIAPLGWFGFVGWVGHRLGRWDGYFAVQMAWNSRFDFGVTTAEQVFQVLRNPMACGFSAIAVTVVLLAAVVLFGCCCTERQPAELLVFSAAMLTITLGDAGAFLSRARFLLPAFPLLLPLATTAARTRSPLAAGLVVGAATVVSAGFGLYLTFISASSL